MGCEEGWQIGMLDASCVHPSSYAKPSPPNFLHAMLWLSQLGCELRHIYGPYEWLWLTIARSVSFTPIGTRVIGLMGHFTLELATNSKLVSVIAILTMSAFIEYLQRYRLRVVSSKVSEVTPHWLLVLRIANWESPIAGDRHGSESSCPRYAMMSCGILYRSNFKLPYSRYGGPS